MLKRSILFTFMILLFGCENNAYMPPEAGPLSIVRLKLNPVIDPGVWENNISASLFVYENVNCTDGKFAANTKLNNFNSIKAEEPITLRIAVYVETKNHKKTTYVSQNIITFKPEAGKVYEITSDYTFSPLLNKDRSLAIPLSISSKIKDTKNNLPIKIIERQRNKTDIYGCAKTYDEFGETDYVEKTSSHSGF
jgi:hypothetical protein